MTRTLPSPRIAAAGLAGAIVLGGAGARAQSDLNRPAPNVMLAVDSSGSMEYTATPAADCAEPPCLPKCYPATTFTSEHERSRWISLVEVLTGTIRNYSCWAQDRSSPDFRDEFRLGTVEPYDGSGRYSLPYHRPQSNLCTPGPGALPGATEPYAFPPGYVTHRPYSPSGNAVSLVNTCSTWEQLNDGLLDSLNRQIRFGLMTFDTHPDPGTGLASGLADHASGTEGAWSYFLPGPPCRVDGVEITTDYCQGNPLGCTTGPFPMEVGARNQYAPPAEGRMVAFGPADATGTELAERNAWIQNVLLATRPYGATPIAGMLADARAFFWEDDTTDPLTGKKFGPRSDEMIFPTCRKNFLILLSDGEPNLDMRPHCEGSTCPYPTPAALADELANSPSHPRDFVRTYAVGFAVSQVDPEGKGEFTPCEDLPNKTYCSDPAYAHQRDLQACCTLNEIAFYGTRAEDRGKPEVLDHALFADNADELRAALSRIFNEALAAVTNRTQPVFSTATAGGTATKAFQFLSAVDVRALDLWKGKLERHRLECGSSGEVQEKPVNVEEGDDFVANVNSEPSRRRFYTVRPAALGGSDRSIRPYIGTFGSAGTDGVGDETGELSGGHAPGDFVGAVRAADMHIDDMSCVSATEPSVPAEMCKTRILQWLVGDDNGTGYHRCRSPGADTCNLVADILHSTPLVRGRPDEFLRDESYAQFAGAPGIANRDTMLYTSSNDGFFHAFFVAPGAGSTQPELKSRRNNEEWAFVPPAVLTGIRSMYPMSHQLLLDGKPVAKDVVAMSETDRFPYRLERTQAHAQNGGGTWRTILVQGFGAQRGGYFALDVTRPVVEPSSPAETGPKFLWQLTTDQDGKSLFGGSGATPLITTLYFDTKEGTDPTREVAVAILPGGDGGEATTSSCDGGPRLEADPPFTAADTVRCYTGADAARSITIVRLDNGRIIRTFRPAGVTQPVAFESSVVEEVQIPAPFVGEPAAFPAQTGTVADRVFIGDREGRLWRLDVANTDPTKWKLEVFFDAYSNPATPGTPREPLTLPPVLSVDDQGRITINLATGDQDVLTRTDGLDNYVYSLTEVIEGGQVKAQVNWRHVFENGDRVIGPMTLFDRRLFFATFSPGAEVCATGVTTVWGENYLVPQVASGDGQFRQGGRGEVPPDPSAAPDPNADTAQPLQRFPPKDGVIYGVGLRQQPSCSVADDQPNVDDFLAFGTATSSTTVSNPGKFQLVFQVGGANPGSSDITTEVLDLPNPRAPVLTDSWAPILE
jgi:type IV pilus assembly protein PilY1